MISTKEFALKIRKRALELCFKNRTSHIGGALSITDVIALLYNEVLSISPETANHKHRDRLFYSKGHACTALYSALQLRGFFSREELDEGFTTNGSYFTSHVNHKIPGIELSTGSLGHALGVSTGVALAMKRQQNPHNVYTILSDGELDEGSNWEAIMFAAHNKLDNLIVIVDYNKIQSFGTVEEVMNLDPLYEKFESFNWHVQEIDGHNLSDISSSILAAKKNEDRPSCIIANTVKGKGISFMEHQLSWHYKSPSEKDYQAALMELENGNA